MCDEKKVNLKRKVMVVDVELGLLKVAVQLER